MVVVVVVVVEMVVVVMRGVVDSFRLFVVIEMNWKKRDGNRGGNRDELNKPRDRQSYI